MKNLTKRSLPINALITALLGALTAQILHEATPALVNIAVGRGGGGAAADGLVCLTCELFVAPQAPRPQLPAVVL